MKDKTKAIVLVSSLFLTVFLIVGLRAVLTGNMIKQEQEQNEYQEWLIDNCTCIEKERILCKEGFVFNGKNCENENLNVFTQVLRACSMYNCTEEIHVFNNQTNKWEKQK